MREKETAKLIELYESKKARRAIYSQCNANQCRSPEYNLMYQVPPCRC